MPNNLWSLFDDRLKEERDLVASEPKSLDDISSSVEEQQRIITSLKRMEQVEPKIDYSDFSNFVFFNSALDYFNITGEKILNEYPYDGSTDDVETFRSSLDGYQRYVLDNWPSRSGHLRFNPTNGFSYVSVNDLGTSDGVSRSSFIGPNTGSMSLELWVIPTTLTGSNDVMVLAQKVTGSGDGFTAYLTGSSVVFRLSSGSSVDEVSAATNAGTATFYSFVYDKSQTSPTISVYSGSASSFPVLVTSATASVVGDVPNGPTKFYMGSGSLSGKTVRPLTGSIDQVSFWSEPRQLTDISSSFNAKLSAQKTLVGLWRFNESGSIQNDVGNNSVCVDSSGHRLHGRITNYYSSVRGSGSLVPYDSPDPILLFDAPEVQSLISEQQISGSTYDRNNDNIITLLLPDQFFQLEVNQNTTVLRDFVYILARQFDFMKQRIDHFVKVNRSNYGEFDQAPDALLADVAKFFGWEFTGNFLNADAFQYIVGKNVLKNLESNRELDTKLYQIKNEFWKRTLVNLMHIYKTKGTRESVESLLRAYGVNKNFVRLKEYGYMPNVGIQTFRISAEKSVPCMTFSSGSQQVTGSLAAEFAFPFLASTTTGVSVYSPLFDSSVESVETHVRFPTSSTTGLTASLPTGSIWVVTDGTNDVYKLFWTRNVSSTTGTLHLTSSQGDLSLTGGFFDGKWYNLSFVRNHSSGTFLLDVRSIENDYVERDSVNFHMSASVSASVSNAVSSFGVLLGAVPGSSSEMWANELKVWSRPLNGREMDDHTLNFQSYGSDELGGISKLDLHYKLKEDVSADSDFGFIFPIFDSSGYARDGAAEGVTPGTNPYTRLLRSYNYIAPPDFSWNEEKVRVLDGPAVSPRDVFSDNGVVALEFNMVDALNEDISQMMSTSEGFDNHIGVSANRYRESYSDIDKMRKEYFKRLRGRLNFRVFADMLEFFDRSFVDMVRRLIPTRAIFLGEEFVVESHVLERPKLQWTYRRQQKFLVPEGSIKIYTRT